MLFCRRPGANPEKNFRPLIAAMCLTGLTVNSVNNLLLNLGFCPAPASPNQRSGHKSSHPLWRIGRRAGHQRQLHGHRGDFVKSAFRKEVQFRMTSFGAWNPSNDWSFTGIATTPGAPPIKLNLGIFHTR